MKSIDRRKFLKLVGMGMGGLAFQQFLSACGIKPTQSTSSPLPRSSTQTPFSSSSPEPSSPPTESPTAARLPYLVVVHGTDPEEMVRQAINAAGGMGIFVKNGSNVIIKPNICVGYHSYEYAATTNPWVVAALVKLCLEAGAGRVRVMDNPFGGTADQCYEVSGIGAEVKAAGGEMEVMQSLKFKKTDVPDGVIQKSLMLYQDILAADLVIDVPIAKHHSGAGLTLSMKNLMGTIQKRELLHMDLSNSIVDLAQRVKPALVVVDALRILTANGPTGGSLDDVQQADTLIVSRDMVAADSFAATLFGKTADDIGYIRTAGERGLGNPRLDELDILEFNVGT